MDLLSGHIWSVGGVAVKSANRACAIGHGMAEGWDIEHASDMDRELDLHSVATSATFPATV